MFWARSNFGLIRLDASGTHQVKQGAHVLIKAADDKQDRLHQLRVGMEAQGSNAKQAKSEYYRLLAGIQGEKDSAYFIDFDYGDSSKNWMVIHDLRLEHAGRTAQIDHLLINRWLEFYVIETKSFNSGVKITDEGEFLRWNDWKKQYEAMESPLIQNERHMAVLRDVVATLEMPQRLGLRIPPEFHSLVMVATKAKVYRSERFDTSRVIKADALKKRIQRDIDDENPMLTVLKAGKIVSSATIEGIARQLARRHRPLAVPASSGDESGSGSKPLSAGETVEVVAPARAPAPAPAPASSNLSHAPRCKSCAGDSGQMLYGKFGYYFKCGACSANTGIRFECKPGHSPRVRKQGAEFFRDCPQCGSSGLFHVNKG